MNLSVRSNADPETILRRFYATPIIQIDDQIYNASHFLGGYFDINQRPTAHSNWLNSRFEKVFNPVIGRALIQRPTLAKTRLTVPEHADYNINPYDFLLCFSDDNIELLTDILSDVSSFIVEENPSAKKLGQALDNSTGITILYHSIWSVSLPTAHLLPPPTIENQHETILLNDAAYANHVKFLVPGPSFKSSLVPPPPNIDSAFYLVGKDPYDKDDPVFKYEIFDKSLHLYPDVLWFQPYVKNPSAINYALTLGLLIENGDIDGVSIPLPNIRMSLTENNSLYIQGSLPLNAISRYIPQVVDNHRLRIPQRTIHSSEDQHTLNLTTS